MGKEEDEWSCRQGSSSTTVMWEETFSNECVAIAGLVLLALYYVYLTMLVARMSAGKELLLAPDTGTIVRPPVSKNTQKGGTRGR